MMKQLNEILKKGIFCSFPIVYKEVGVEEDLKHSVN